MNAMTFDIANLGLPLTELPTGSFSEKQPSVSFNDHLQQARRSEETPATTRSGDDRSSRDRNSPPVDEKARPAETAETASRSETQGPEKAEGKKGGDTTTENPKVNGDEEPGAQDASSTEPAGAEAALQAAAAAVLIADKPVEVVLPDAQEKVQGAPVAVPTEPELPPGDVPSPDASKASAARGGLSTIEQEQAGAAAEVKTAPTDAQTDEADAAVELAGGLAKGKKESVAEGPEIVPQEKQPAAETTGETPSSPPPTSKKRQDASSKNAAKPDAQAAPTGPPADETPAAPPVQGLETTDGDHQDGRRGSPERNEQPPQGTPAFEPSPSKTAQSAVTLEFSNGPRAPALMATSPAAGKGHGDLPLSQAEQSRFLQRVVRAFQLTGEGGHVRLRLSPPELGSLRLEVTVQQGVMTAHVEAETPQARLLLLENLPALRERLQEQNIKIERFDVDLMNQFTGGQPQGFQERNPERPETPAVQRRTDATAAGAAEPTLVRGSRRVGGGEQLNVVV